MAKSTPTPVTPVPTSPAVQALEEKLKLAKAASQPVIIEKVSEDQDQIVYMDHTHGTKRVDTLGGPRNIQPLQFVDLPGPEEAVWGQAFEGGKVVSQTESRREIDLASGSRRTDVK